MKGIEMWIDSILEKPLPEEIVAVAFNLYEDEGNRWSVELVGCGGFDAEDSDWACDEVFDIRDNPLSWAQDATWEVILREVADAVREYLRTGKYCERLKSCMGVGVGFVDGDLTVVYRRQEADFE